ncbi:MAG: hypothetical protein IJQ59_03495 [Bacteroidaceae bacterium]|nr:hypothetical protein [Bacteroidaceae bacterium]
MKKIYSTPQLQIVNVEIHGTLLDNVSVSEKEISSSNAGLTKDEGGWDEVWDD